VFNPWACPNVICSSPFPCLRQAITGNSGQSLPSQVLRFVESNTAGGQIQGGVDSPRTRKEAQR
jgi:hypothetical protein